MVVYQAEGHGVTDPLRSAVRIVLPTFNRATFLPKALQSIREQTWTDWELVIVDDGSQDNTRECLSDLGRGMPQTIRYIYQENAGAYPARKTGLAVTSGKYIAFFDSDDCWLPHHLADCVAALEANPDVDWVYGASQCIDLRSGTILAPNCFYVEGKPRPFLQLHTRRVGRLRIIEDPDVIRCMILHGLYCGFQSSVMRRQVFADTLLNTDYWNEAEDQLFVIRALASGHRLAYYDNVHVLYHEHADNSSAAGSGKSIEKHRAIYEAMIRGFEDLRSQVRLSKKECNALKRRLSREYFWGLGYAILWNNRCRREALRMFWRGLRLSPWDLRYWKTYALAVLRTSCTLGGRHE